MEIIVASNNKNKIKEIKTILKDFDVKSLDEVGFHDEIEETGTTFKENALIKAKTIYDIYKIPVIADDSGLCVEALNLAPGVYSHRYASPLCDDKLNNEKLIKNLYGIKNRKAYYACVLCFYDGKEYYSEGRCFGEIIDEARGDNGFGYDPFFFIPSLNKTMAELTLDEKNKISHRGIALRDLEVKINEIFNRI